MKKEHNEQMERHKAGIEQQKKTIQDMDTGVEAQKNKLFMDVWTQNSEHAKALRKEQEGHKMEAHRTVMKIKQKHQKVLHDHLKDLIRL